MHGAGLILFRLYCINVPFLCGETVKFPEYILNVTNDLDVQEAFEMGLKT